MSRELRDLLEQTARGPCDPTFDPAGIAVKAGRQRRWGAVAAAVVVVVALVGGAAWVRSLAAGPQTPFVESSPPDVAPVGWQTVQVGRAALSVPPDWEVRTTEGARSLPCDPFEVPAIWIGGSPAPTCPAPVPPPQHVGIIATQMLLVDGAWPDEQPVVVDGHEGSWIDIGDGKRQYRFPTLDVMLTVAYGPDPQLAEQVLSTLRSADGGTVVEASPAQPSATAQPEELDSGAVLSLDSLPAMSQEGIAVQTSAGVMFIGIDGTVHGHLPDAELGSGGPAVGVPGLIPIDAHAAPDQDTTGSRWVQPALGTSIPRGQVTAPLRGSFEVVELATGGDPSPLALHAPDSREIARFSANLQWNVSADHRAVSWHECPDDARDLSSCSGHAYDVDMGSELQMETGCWVSDSFADFNHALVCWQGWASGDEESWIERRGPGQAASRIPVPRQDGDDAAGTGHYLNAFLDGNSVVATWRAPCERSIDVPPEAHRDVVVIATLDGQPRPLIGDDLATAPAARVLGIAQDGQAVVHVLDSPECGQAGPPGIYLIDTDTGNTTRILTASGVQTAEMWTPQPTLNN